MESHTIRVYSRKALYDLIWSKSINKLSKELEINEYQLRTICKKYQIPLPKSGYWSKLRHQKTVKIEPLPEVAEWEKLQIDFDNPPLSKQAVYKFKLNRKIKEIKAKHPKLLNVSLRLIRPDFLVNELQNKINSSESDRYIVGEHYYTRYNNVPLYVTRKNVSRGLRIADSLIKLLRARNHILELRSDVLFITYNKEGRGLRIWEKRTMQKSDERYGSTKFVPNGNLALKFGKSYFEKEWSDGKQLLEDKLVTIVAEIELILEKEAKERDDRKIYWAEQEKLQKEKDKLKAIKEWESKKVDLLIEHASRWSQSQQIESFILEVEEKIKQEKNRLPSTEVWLKWAKSICNELNPLSVGVNELLDSYEFKDQESDLS